MDLVLLLPSLLQGLVMMVDEFYFHNRRGLGRWERIGHPVDTATVLACYAILLFTAFNHENLILFSLASVMSCVTITKDEFVHQKACSGAENWLHSVLFILHPLVLGAGGLSWYLLATPASPLWGDVVWLTPTSLQWALSGQAVLIGGFFCYQTFYWNYLCRPAPAPVIKSITPFITPSANAGTAPTMIR